MGLTQPLLLLLLLGATEVAGNTKLKDGGYTDVVVVITPAANIVAGQQGGMLSRLEDMFTTASSLLFEASHRYVYFKEIIIAVPEEWADQKNYGPALESQIARPEVVIDVPNPAHGNNPYARMTSTCGLPGEFVHLTPEYMLNDSLLQNWGPRGKVMVHEWAHLRWGVFDEYPVGPEDSQFYDINKPTACIAGIEGSKLNQRSRKPCQYDWNKGMYELDCRFFPKKQQPLAKASLMYAAYVDTTIEFCDNTESDESVRHNGVAPNRQNRLCQSKSVWEVMREHADFGPGCVQLPAGTDTTPTFRYVRMSPTRRVLVLDVSGSMEGEPIAVLKQAVSSIVLTTVEKDSWLGIVKFNNKASTLSGLIQIASKADRESLVRKIPTHTNGFTSIGAGLLKGLEVLQSAGVTSGGKLILVTDGEENRAPLIANALPNLKKSGVVVDAIAFGTKADKNITEVCSQTNGKVFFYNQKQNSTSLFDGLASSIDSGSNFFTSADVPQMIQSTALTASTDQPVTGSFYVDATLGRDTLLVVSYRGRIAVEVVGPGGEYTRSPDSGCGKCLDEFQVFQMDLPNGIEPGSWNYSITSNMDQTVSLTVQSKAGEKGAPVIKVRSWLEGSTNITFDPKKPSAVLFAEVVRGTAPVLGAEVLANVENSMDDASLVIQLFDSGSGLDIIKNDGVYTGIILPNELTANGRHNIKVTVLGVEGQTQVITGLQGAGSRAMGINPPGPPINESVGNFQRVRSAGEFQVTGFTPGPVADEIPPARITDLRLTSVRSASGLTSLEWTSVGDEMDRGTASRYIIYVSDNFQQLLTNASQAWQVHHDQVVKGNLSQPKPPRHLEQVDIALRVFLANGTRYLGVVAVDEAGNDGDLSNIVSIDFDLIAKLKDEASTANVMYSNFSFLFASFIVAVLSFLNVFQNLQACF